MADTQLDFSRVLNPIKFESLEHTSIGDSLTITTATGAATDAAKYILKTVAGVDLTIGRVIGLAGDYYTCPRNHAITGDREKPRPPLEEMKKNARAAVGTLSGNACGYLKALDGLFLREEEAIKKALEEGMPAAVAYGKPIKGLPGTWEYTRATWLYYPIIAWNNFDHFGSDARAAYTACHAVALDLASAAGGSEDGLNAAYLVDAFGLHFLTDSFSSGHLRAPRRALHDYHWWTAFPSGIIEAPVWDIQSKYMHDEDSACGLWVQNEEGQEWIAYGDKQFFDGPCRLNRIRCINACQSSVDEIYTAFASKSVPEVSTYAALKQAPKPQPAVVSPSDRGWTHDNFAPLWVHDASAAKDDRFTVRKDINDHSKHERASTYPGYVALQWPPLTPSKAAAAIKSSAWRATGEIPFSIPMEPRSGGFVQFQEHSGAAGTGRVSSANVWGPIVVDIPNLGPRYTFTLRNRSRNIAENPFSDRTLHWESYFDASSGKTSFLRFNRKDGSGAVEIDGWSFGLNQPDTSSQVVHFADVDTSPLVLREAFSRVPLLHGFRGYGLSSARFFVAPWIGPPSSPDVISVTFDASTWQPRITVTASTSLLPPFSSRIDFADSGAPKVAWSTVKLLSGRLLVAGSVSTEDRSVLLYLRDYSVSSGTLEAHQTVLTLPGAAGLPVQVLVGDVLATGAEMLVVVVGARVHLYTVSRGDEEGGGGGGGGGGLSYTATGVPAATAAQLPDRNHVLTALTPSEAPEGGLDILTVYARTGTLEFTYSVRGGPGTSHTIDDELAVAAAENYAPISWHRARWQHTANAVVQVFEWFGMLGVRMFAPAQDDGKWSMVGLCTSLGQPANVANAGIVSWGPNDRWTDVVEGYEPRPEM